MKKKRTQALNKEVTKVSENGSINNDKGVIKLDTAELNLPKGLVETQSEQGWSLDGIALVILIVSIAFILFIAFLISRTPLG